MFPAIRAFSAFWFVLVVSGPAQLAAAHETGAGSVFVVPHREVARENGIELLAQPFVETIDDMPLRETYVSMRRISFEPGATMTEQPLDGPKLLLVEAGSVTLRPARSGALVTTPGAPAARPLDAGADHQIAVGEIAWVPAGVPIKLSNQSNARATWLQIQIETPATLCACGEDLTGVTSELLASETLAEPLTGPGYVTLQVRALADAAQSAAPSVEHYVSLTGATPDSADQQLASDPERVGEVYVFTVTRGSPTT